MAKTLRTLTDPDFQTKNATLTWEEGDQNFIDLHNQMTDGNFDLNVGSLNIGGNAFVDSSRNITGLTLDTGQGANELYPMNQAVRTTDDVEFERLFSLKDALAIIKVEERAPFSYGTIFKMKTADQEWRINNSYEGTKDSIVFRDHTSDVTRAELSKSGNWYAQTASFGINNSEGYTFNVGGTGNFKDTLTINGTQLFDLGKEQNLSDDATGVSFGDLTLVSGAAATDNFSDWFSVTPTGWEVAYDGTGDFRTIFVDELIAKAITADVAQALAGSDFLTKSVAKLAEDFTIPAVSSSGTITVEDLPGLEDLAVFEANDWLRIRIVDTTSSPAVIGDVYGQVTSYSDNADGTQDWTFTTDYAGASDVLVGQTVYKGAIILDYGVSGDTFNERTVLDRSGASDFSKVPYDRIVRWTNAGSGGPRPSAAGYSAEVLTQRGNINGLGGFSSATFGMYAKDNVLIELDGGNMNIGKDVGGAGVDGIHIDSNDFWYTDGTGSVGNGILNWDANVPEVNLASFTANDKSLQNDEIYIGDDIQDGVGFFRMLMGMWDTGSDRFPAFRIQEGSQNIVNIFNRPAIGEYGIIVRNASGDSLFRAGNENFIAGAYFDATDMWGYEPEYSGDTSNKSNASVRLDFADGRIYYDAMATVLYNGQSVADFTANDEAPLLTANEWETGASVTGTGSSVNTNTKVIIPYLHKFGYNSIIVTGYIRAEASSDGSFPQTATADVQTTVGGQTASSGTSSASALNFEHKVDVRSLTPGNYYTLKVELVATVDASNSNSGLDQSTVTAYLREDLTLIATTEEV